MRHRFSLFVEREVCARCGASSELRVNLYCDFGSSDWLPVRLATWCHCEASSTYLNRPRSDWLRSLRNTNSAIEITIWIWSFDRDLQKKQTEQRSMKIRWFEGLLLYTQSDALKYEHFRKQSGKWYRNHFYSLSELNPCAEEFVISHLYFPVFPRSLKT